MNLHILRHAKTEPFSDSGEDFDRVLLKKGVKQAEEMSNFFAEHNVNPQAIYCSDAKRTRQTLSLVKKGLSTENISYHSELYLSSLRRLLDFVWEIDTNLKEVMIVGHNNGLSELISYFTDVFIDLSTCEFVTLEFECESAKETSKGNGKITLQFHPKVSG